MVKALLIAPYSGLEETAKKIDVPENFELDTTVANLEEGVTKAKRAEEQGYDVIISRGGTASMIQEEVSIPVVHIEITGYDMLRVFTLIKGVKSGVALVGFKNISEGAVTICNILDFDVKMVTIQSSTEVRSNLEQLREQGISVVIGDVITVEVAQQLGLRGVLITSGKEAIMNAIDESKRIHQFFRRVNYHYRNFQRAFLHMPLPMIIVNDQLKIIEKNEKFSSNEVYRNILRTSAFSQLVDRVLRYQTNQWEAIESDSTTYLLQAFLISKQDRIIGIQFDSSLPKMKESAIEVISNPVHQPMIGDSKIAHEIEDMVNQAATNNRMIRIIGEPGVGKYTIAEQIHFKRFGQQAPMIRIEGELLTEDAKQLDHIYQIVQPITTGSVVIKQFNSMTLETQRKLMKTLNQSVENQKVIVLETDSGRSGTVPDEIETSDVLYIPPLRERKEDILAFVDYFLTEMHMREGSEIVGIKEDAAQVLLDFEWKRNIAELKTVVKQLSHLTTDYYIELSHINVLKQNEGSDKNSSALLKGTLKEIEKEIIKQVLQEENQNQTKAAERLGINRSTLWRKMKTD